MFGTSYRNLFAFVLLLLILVLRPNGLFSRAAQRAAGAADRHLHRAEPAGARPALGAPGARGRCSRCCRSCASIAYVLQMLTNAWLYGVLALSLTLVAGTVGLVSLGHAGLLAIGAYASALLALNFGVPVGARDPRRRRDHGRARHAADSSRPSGCAGTTSRSRRSASARSSRW